MGHCSGISKFRYLKTSHGSWPEWPCIGEGESLSSRDDPGLGKRIFLQNLGGPERQDGGVFQQPCEREPDLRSTLPAKREISSVQQGDLMHQLMRIVIDLVHGASRHNISWPVTCNTHSSSNGNLSLDLARRSQLQTQMRSGGHRLRDCQKTHGKRQATHHTHDASR